MEPLTRPHRRRFLTMAGLAGAGWLTPIAHLLARDAEATKSEAKAQSIIMLWMQGGPSQIETFDPHDGKDIAAGSTSIATAVKGVRIGKGLDGIAEEMESISLIRSLVSKEGDHERGTYTLKTGHRPDPTVVHPSIGSVMCHDLPTGGVDIPRHVSILPGQWPARGGFFGDQYDAFRMEDPAGPVPDTQSYLPDARDQSRLEHLSVVESAFRKGRESRVDRTLHQATIDAARKMMTSDQLKAFDVSREPADVRKRYGDSAFGRGCLAARRLIEVGVRCVEVTLSGWDTHINNHSEHAKQFKILDPAFSALIRDLRERKLLDRTLVIWCGEFGRTPKLNAAGGRDHWPNGFSAAIAGGGVRGGRIVGATDPDGKATPESPVQVGDLHATILRAVGLDPTKITQTPIGRTMKYAEGSPLSALLS